MARISWKTIKGRKYAYIAKSVRLPSGKVATITKRLSQGEEKKRLSVLVKKYSIYFAEKEKELAARSAAFHYKTSYIFSPQEIEKLESVRLEYSRLIRKLDRDSLKDVLDRFTANYTYDSNAIEGNSLTLKDVSIVMFEKETVPGKTLREIYETRNSRTVVEMIFRKKFRLNHKDIIRMHRLLMKDIDVRTGYKKLPNIIYKTEKQIETTPPEKVEKEMTALLDLCNSSMLHPLELAAVFHGRFERIHPFEDGNGRVGRFLINVILINNGYPPLIIRKTSRRSYMSALAAFDTGHEDKLKRFILKKFKETYEKFFEIYTKYV